MILIAIVLLSILPVIFLSCDKETEKDIDKKVSENENPEPTPEPEPEPEPSGLNGAWRVYQRLPFVWYEGTDYSFLLGDLFVAPQNDWYTGLGQDSGVPDTVVIRSEFMAYRYIDDDIWYDSTENEWRSTKFLVLPDSVTLKPDSIIRYDKHTKYTEYASLPAAEYFVGKLSREDDSIFIYFEIPLITYQQDFWSNNLPIHDFDGMNFTVEGIIDGDSLVLDLRPYIKNEYNDWRKGILSSNVLEIVYNNLDLFKEVRFFIPDPYWKY